MQHWEHDLQYIAAIRVYSSANNESVKVVGYTPHLTCIGIGTDAAVFRSVAAPHLAYKIYAEDKRSSARREALVYEKLGEQTYFPRCYAAYERFLVLSYEPGFTLHDCLLRGIHISPAMVEQVEHIRQFIRSKQLNPRDIHLKNIILQNNRVKLIDVSEYAIEGNDQRWEHLKKGYEQYYHFIDGYALPEWLVTASKKYYNEQRKQATFNYDTFMSFIFRIAKRSSYLRK